MNAGDLIALMPLVTIAAFSIIVMLATSFTRNHRLSFFLTAAGLLIALFMTAFVSSPVPRQVTQLLVVDRYALFYQGLILAGAFAVVLLSYDYMEGREGNHNEYYILLLLAVLGSGVLVSSTHFASFFLGLEILSVSLYAMIAYTRGSEKSDEAGLKYLVLAAASASFLLFGMALVYAQYGTMSFGTVAAAIAGSGPRLLSSTGLVLIIIGIGFKLAVVPFHMWTPDVYEGAPAPVTAFVASVSKGAMFGLLLRLFTVVNVRNHGPLLLVFTVISIASMFTGNLLALLQNNVKRMLAYSSIAHMGYLLVAFMANGRTAVMAVSYYLVAYFITTIGAFGVVSALSGADRDADSISDYRGLIWRRPALGGIFAAMLLSLAGMPLTAGFFAKFYLVTAGVGSSLWLLVTVLVINSGLGLFYYIRIIAVMYERVPALAGEAVVSALGTSETAVISGLAVLLVWVGVFPSPLLRLLENTVTALVGG